MHVHLSVYIMHIYIYYVTEKKANGIFFRKQM